MQLELVALVVGEYDSAIDFFVDVLGFELVEDSPSFTNDGRPKRWVVIGRPGPDGLLLAQADGAPAVGRREPGRRAGWASSFASTTSTPPTIG